MRSILGAVTTSIVNFIQAYLKGLISAYLLWDTYFGILGLQGSALMASLVCKTTSN